SKRITRGRDTDMPRFSQQADVLQSGSVTVGHIAKWAANGVIADGQVNLSNVVLADIAFIIDGGGSVITPGVKGDLDIPFPCTINQAVLLADQSGSIVIDIWKAPYASYPPTVANSIVASAPPTISSGIDSKDSTLTGWSKTINAGDILRFNVN